LRGGRTEDELGDEHESGEDGGCDLECDLLEGGAEDVDLEERRFMLFVVDNNKMLMMVVLIIRGPVIVRLRGVWIFM